MSSILSTAALNSKPQKPSTTPILRMVTSIGIIISITMLASLTTGCSTTQEFKPTASVIVGAHKSL